MRVLITGAAGFIGRALVRDRLGRGDAVTACDRTAMDFGAGVRTQVADIGDAHSLANALEGVERVFHLAAAHLDALTPDDEYRRVNVDATRQLVRAAAEAGVRRIVHCSSVGVYGNVAGPPAREDALKDPGNIYERTKLEGERAALEEARGCGIEVVVVRPSWVYGAGCPRTRRLVRAIARRRFFYFGRGTQLRHPVHLADVLEGFERAAVSGTPGAVYNLAGPQAVPLRELVDAVARAAGTRPPRLHIPYAVGWCAAVAAEAVLRPLGRKPPLSRRSLLFFRNANAYSNDAAQRDLGYAPRVALEEGMRRVVQELRQEPAHTHGHPSPPVAALQDRAGH